MDETLSWPENAVTMRYVMVEAISRPLISESV